MKIPLWTFIPAYIQPELTGQLVDSIRCEDSVRLDEIVQSIERTADKHLCLRELHHTIQKQFSGKQALRELIQNSMDASRGSYCNINVEYNPGSDDDSNENSNNFTFEDAGKGMGIDDVVEYLLVVGNSSKVHDQKQMGAHGQGFFALLKDAESVAATSRGWRTIITKEDEEYYVEFTNDDSQEVGTKITVVDYNSDNFAGQFSFYSKYVNPDKAKITLDGKQVNSRDCFDFSLEEKIVHEGQEYNVGVHLGAVTDDSHDLRAKIYYTQDGLPILQRSIYEDGPKILVDVPLEITLSRGRNVTPPFIEKSINKNLKKYRRLYINHLLENLRDLNSDQLSWLEKNTYQSTVKSIANLGGRSIGLPLVLAGCNEIKNKADSISEPIGDLIGYSMVTFVGLIGLFAVGILGYGAYNKVKGFITDRNQYDGNKRKTDEDEKPPRSSKYIDILTNILFGMTPRYNFRRKKIIPAKIRKKGQVLERKISLHEMRKANKKERLFFGEVRKRDGVYLPLEYQNRYSSYGKRNDKFDLSWMTQIAYLPLLPLKLINDIAIPVPYTLTKAASVVGIGKKKAALQEAASYISSFVAKSNRMQNVGVVIGYSGTDKIAWTAKPPGLAPSYVALNVVVPEIRKLEQSMEDGLSDSDVRRLTHLVAHEYAHHSKKGFLADSSHNYEFYEKDDDVKTKLFNHLANERIDLTFELNRIAGKYFHQKRKNLPQPKVNALNE